MSPIRVLVVDDSVVARRIVRTMLEDDPEIEVVGTASNGRIALDRIDQLTPDLVTLDVEMPVMSGLEALEEIRRRHPALPVIMVSSQTEAGASSTIEALSKGASDYVHKPSSMSQLDSPVDEMQASLIPKIKALCTKAQATPVAEPRVRRKKIVRKPVSRVDMLAIGVSTGGPAALAVLMPMLPKNLSVPIVIVQHMPPIFTRQLAERLDSLSELTVKEGTNGAQLEAGVAWIAPGNFHMVVESSKGSLRLRTNQEARENSCRPAVDTLFRSVAQHCGPHALAVVLTGMGHDGMCGCEAIQEGGGRVVVQDEASSVVWGMPGAVANSDLADVILPLDQIAAEITRSIPCTSTRQTPASVRSRED